MTLCGNGHCRGEVIREEGVPLIQVTDVPIRQPREDRDVGRTPRAGQRTGGVYLQVKECQRSWANHEKLEETKDSYSFQRVSLLFVVWLLTCV